MYHGYHFHHILSMLVRIIETYQNICVAQNNCRVENLYTSFCTYVTNRESQVRIPGIFSSPLVSHSDFFRILSVSMYLLITCVMKLITRGIYVEDIKIICGNKSPNDRNLTLILCNANFMKEIISEIEA